ncbi:MAG: hydrogenase maturation nickel metallochaperone HypA [Planctomycetes bacterium]|nr:hydrogenase maturation nickel metallochaperone HypA [Planctomycetota bacterium]
MHELSLAQSVWRQVEAEMAARPGSAVLALDLVVGAFSGADAESLEFALGLLVADSSWPEARIRIRPEPVVLRCRACGREFEMDGACVACPGCGGDDVEPVRGMDLRLESLEVE